MREILFKGKTIDDKKWVYGVYYHQTEFYNDPSDVHCIIYKGTLEYLECGYERVIPETVGQYTGFDDINGVKIFEGDIIKYTKDYYPCYCGKAKPQVVVAPIVYEHSTFYTGWFEVKSGHRKGKKQRMLLCHSYENFEVIGNVWDNPELLEEGNISEFTNTSKIPFEKFHKELVSYFKSINGDPDPKGVCWCAYCEYCLFNKYCYSGEDAVWLQGKSSEEFYKNEEVYRLFKRHLEQEGRDG